MLSKDELRTLLVKAKEDGCTKFPEDKGYKGAGFSVLERITSLVEEKGIDAKITKAGLKVLVKQLRTDKTFKGLTKFSAEVRVPGTARRATDARPSLSDIFGFGTVATEQVSTNAPSQERITNTTNDSSWGNVNAANAAPVPQEVDDDPFG